jgi:hypothetical protein
MGVMLTYSLLTELQQRYALGPIRQVRPLHGSEWKMLYSLDGDQTVVAASNLLALANLS